MKPLIIKSFLLLVFIVSAYFVFEPGTATVIAENDSIRPGYLGSALGFGLIAAASLFAFVYYECHHKITPSRKNDY